MNKPRRLGAITLAIGLLGLGLGLGLGFGLALATGPEATAAATAGEPPPLIPASRTEGGVPANPAPGVTQAPWFRALVMATLLGVTALAAWWTSRSRLQAKVARELDEHRATRELLAAGQLQLRRVLDTLPVAAFACEPDGRLSYHNRHAALLWGRAPRLHDPKERYCGSDQLRTLDGEPIPRERSPMALCLAECRAITGVEVIIDRPGGDQRIAVAHVSPLLDPNGTLIGAVSVLLDVTQDRRAQESLAASEVLLRQLIRHTPASVAMFDIEMRILHTSDRWLADFRLEGCDIIGRPLHEVLPDLPAHWEEVCRRVLGGAIERRDEDLLERPGRPPEWLHWEARPWRKAAGRIGGLILFTQFITDRRHTEVRLREQLDELQRWQRLTVGREERLQQLKREVNALAARLGESAPYPSQDGGLPDAPAFQHPSLPLA